MLTVLSHPRRTCGGLVRRELLATIYEALGISADTRIPDPQGRPVPIIEDGRALRKLFG